MLSKKPWDGLAPCAQVRRGAVVIRSSGCAAPRAIWVLLILFIALQVADVVTTNYALAIAGNWEVNPLMKFAQTHWGPSWWIPKLAGAGLAAGVVLHLRRPWPIACAVSYYVLIVSGNLACL
jgi:Domain of unknown function (DUF5658)